MKGKKGYTRHTADCGRQLKVITPDNSNIWLNALSSIWFPTRFSGGSRLVQAEGELFFHIASHPSPPFVAYLPDMEIRTGSAVFYINSYADEPAVRISVFEGDVQVRTAHHSVRVMTGKEISIDRKSLTRHEQTADRAAAVSWVHGYFDFDNKNFAAVMRELQRWYGIDIRIEPESDSDITFWGGYPRSCSIHFILAQLGTQGLCYKLKGNEVSVSCRHEVPAHSSPSPWKQLK
jgi:transmembrane sensor